MQTQALLVIMVLTLVSFYSNAGGAQVEGLLTEINRLSPQQRQKRLEEGARKEGAFKFYGVSNSALLSAYTNGFMKKYPFVKAEFWRGIPLIIVTPEQTEETAKPMQKIMQEILVN